MNASLASRIAPADSSSGANASAEDKPAEDKPAAVLMRFELPPLAMEIRILQESDVRLLEWHGGADLRLFYQWQWAQHRTRKREVLVAVLNEVPIGQVAIQWQDKPSHPSIPDIQSLRVQDAFRGLGIGSRLLEACETQARARGFEQIGIAVSLENHGARRLYERKGYHPSGVPYEDHWDYINARGELVVMREVVCDLIKNLSRDQISAPHD
jgi:ribosomal protein S18 acetylase RimI-like enzyme